MLFVSISFLKHVTCNFTVVSADVVIISTHIMSKNNNIKFVYLLLVLQLRFHSLAFRYYYGKFRVFNFLKL